MTVAARPPLAVPPHVPQPVPSGMEERLAVLGARVAPAAWVQLGDFLGRLLAMNELMNLVSRVDAATAWERHIFDSLTLLPRLADVPAGGRLLDVGTGGGLPGMPLAIARPDLAVTLLDATQKKVRFLAQVAEAMELGGVSAIAGRAEQLASGELRESFDVVTARAVSGLAALVKLTAPFVKRGGRLLLTKGQKAEDEASEAAPVLRQLGLVLAEIARTPTGRIVVIERPLT